MGWFFDQQTIDQLITVVKIHHILKTSLLWTHCWLGSTKWVVTKVVTKSKLNWWSDELNRMQSSHDSFIEKTMHKLHGYNGSWSFQRSYTIIVDMALLDWLHNHDHIWAVTRLHGSGDNHIYGYKEVEIAISSNSPPQASGWLETMSLSRRYKKRDGRRGFVKMSAVWSVDGIWWITSSFFCTSSRMKW